MSASWGKTVRGWDVFSYLFHCLSGTLRLQQSALVLMYNPLISASWRIHVCGWDVFSSVGTSSCHIVTQLHCPDTLLALLPAMVKIAWSALGCQSLPHSVLTSTLCTTAPLQWHIRRTDAPSQASLCSELGQALLTSCTSHTQTHFLNVALSRKVHQP